MLRNYVHCTFIYTYLFFLVSLLNNISTFIGLVMLKLSLKKNNSCTIWPGYLEGIRRFKGFSPKMKLIARLEFKFVYYDVAVLNMWQTARGQPRGDTLIFFLCLFLKVFFCTRSYLIWTIFKQIYLIHWGDPNRYNHSGSERTWE